MTVVELNSKSKKENHEHDREPLTEQVAIEASNGMSPTLRGLVLPIQVDDISSQTKKCWPLRLS